jgi:molybdopterin-containing oxidoreductase family iron-sulfur binding subunit
MRFDGFDFANLLIKTREGRPIKIDNNTIWVLNLLQMLEACFDLSLYDNMRLKSPKIAGKEATWSAVDAKIKTSIADAKAKGGQVVLLLIH